MAGGLGRQGVPRAYNLQSQSYWGISFPPIDMMLKTDGYAKGDQVGKRDSRSPGGRDVCFAIGDRLGPLKCSFARHGGGMNRHEEFWSSLRILPD